LLVYENGHDGQKFELDESELHNSSNGSRVPRPPGTGLGSSRLPALPACRSWVPSWLGTRLRTRDSRLPFTPPMTTRVPRARRYVTETRVPLHTQHDCFCATCLRLFLVVLLVSSSAPPYHYIPSTTVFAQPLWHLVRGNMEHDAPVVCQKILLLLVGSNTGSDLQLVMLYLPT
jgi:hypothetical protein